MDGFGTLVGADAVKFERLLPGPIERVWSELTTEAEQVRLRVVHRRLPGTALPQVGAGWHTLLDRLDARLQGQEAEPIAARFATLEPAYEARFSA